MYPLNAAIDFPAMTHLRSTTIVYISTIKKFLELIMLWKFYNNLLI